MEHTEDTWWIFTKVLSGRRISLVVERRRGGGMKIFGVPSEDVEVEIEIGRSGRSGKYLKSGWAGTVIGTIEHENKMKYEKG